jgi:hypothetical protein
LHVCECFEVAQATAGTASTTEINVTFIHRFMVSSQSARHERLTK